MPNALPDDLLGALAVIKQFHAVYSPAPVTYGLTALNASALDSLISKLENAIAEETAAKTAFDVAKTKRRTAFRELEAEYRAQRRDAKADRNISPENRTALGIEEPDTTPTPIAAPTTHPVLEVDTSERLMHIVEFYDESANNTGRRAKPEGVGTCEIRYAVTAAAAPAPSDPESFKYHSDDSASPCEINHPAEDAGKTAHYIGRWKTRTGLTGTWSATVSATITG